MRNVVLLLVSILSLSSCSKDDELAYRLTIEIKYAWPYDTSFTPADKGATIKQYLNINSHDKSVSLNSETMEVYVDGVMLIPNNIMECDIMGRAVFDNLPDGLHTYLIISGNLEGKTAFYTIKTREKDQKFSYAFK